MWERYCGKLTLKIQRNRSERAHITDVVDRAKADYRATHKVGVQSCKVYVKPEENAIYYVINKVAGKLEL